MIEHYLRVVYASLRRKKLRSWLTLIGILIGIAAVISLMMLGDGIRGAVLGQFDLLNTNVLAVRAEGIDQGPPGTGVQNPLLEYYADDVESINGVDTVVARIIEDAQIRFNDRSHFSWVGSFPEEGDIEDIQKILSLEIAKGSMIEPGDTTHVVIGDDYANGDVFGEPIRLRDTVTIEGKKFKVKGIFTRKGSFIVDRTMTINENALRELFDTPDTYDALAVKVASGANMGLVAERIEDYLRDERDVDEGEEDFVVETPEEALKSLDSLLFGIQIFVFLIAAISILVGGIGIANTMYTSVVERTKEIGIMKAIGARRSQIVALFLTEAGMLGLLGGFLGMVVGVGGALGLAAVGNSIVGEGTIMLTVSPTVIMATLLFSFIVGIVSGILPAIKASKLQPVEALRFSK